MILVSPLFGFSRNEVSAREGIDTYLQTHLPRCSLFRRNEVSAREGIDTCGGCPPSI